MRWGVTAVFVIFGGVLLGYYFIKYPDIIESPVEITTYNPPVDLITRYDGLIDTLCVRDGAMVESGALVAVLSNTSKYDDVQTINQKLSQISALSFDEAVGEAWINERYTLGDLQASFANFQKSCRDYNHYIQTEHIKRKKELLQQQVAKKVSQAYIDQAIALEKCHSTKMYLISATEAAHQVDKKYNLGSATIVDYNTSIKNQVDAESKYLQAKYEYLFKTRIIRFYLSYTQ